MNVVVTSLTEEAVEERDYCDIVEISVDGKKVAKFVDGEPEDNNMGRNFEDVYRVADLMKKAYWAGKNGEEFTLEENRLEEI
jgi:hypothetical protein